MLPAEWAPVQGVRLVRVGPAHDGGYVIPEPVMDRVDVLVSCGLNDDWRFEQDFLARTGARVECYDHTVDDAFWRWRLVRHGIALRHGPTRQRLRELRKRAEYMSFFDGDSATHHRVKIGYDGVGSTSLSSVLEAELGRAVFLKIDIEGAEYRVLEEILEHSSGVLGFVVELHDIDLHRARISQFVAAATDYRVVHVHANNYGGTDGNGDPLVIEMTFARADLLTRDPHYSDAGPSLDSPNDPRSSELSVRFGG